MKKITFYCICLLAIFILNSAEVMATAHTAKDITERYYNTRDDCGGPNEPAFLCSGVLIRGTQYSQNYHSWNPSPQSIKDQGISFSYLRRDSKFSHFARNYNHGVIFYPVYHAPKQKIDPDYLCIFPTDGATDSRSDHGCGMFPGAPNSQPCQDLGIFSGEKWINGLIGFPKLFQDSYRTCGFTVRDHAKPSGGTAKAFSAALKGMRLYGRQVKYGEPNEIVVKTWGQNLGKQLPIEAFFYLAGGLSGAQADQRDLWNTDHIWVPIIKIKLPQTINEEASFHYYANDQALPPQ